MANQLTIVHAEDEVDLRTVVAQSVYLRRISHKYSLKPYECVCFTNKARTRFRLIFKVGGSADAVFLCIPEIDMKSKYSVYLKVSEVLARLTGVSRIQVMMGDLADFTKGRIQRSIKRRKALRKKK
jgi:hypothetical protein